jgi:PBP1b-binding outer membrane lipoprotein LpoB
MCRYAFVTALAIFLAGCVGRTEQPAPVEEAKPGLNSRTANAAAANRAVGTVYSGAARPD